MNVVLVYPPLLFARPQPSEGHGKAAALGLLYCAAFARAAGHRVTVINAFNEGIGHGESFPNEAQQLFRVGLSDAEITARIPPDTELIGVSIPFSNTAAVAHKLLAHLRTAFPLARIVAGGVHASLFPLEALHAGADVAVVGEGEQALAALASGTPCSAVPGAVFLDGKNERFGAPPAFIDDLDLLPSPYAHAADVTGLFERPPRGGAFRATAPVITSRGCPFDCTFCSVHPVYGRKWRARSPANVLDELGMLHEKYGVGHIHFEDDNLTLNPGRAREIFEGMIRRLPRLTWAAHNGIRVDTLDSELVALMKRSGCEQLNLAAESGCSRVLEAMNKKLSPEDIEKAVRLCVQHGIKAAAFWVIGHPGETDAAFEESVRFFLRMRRIGLHAVIPLIVNAYPGTRLFDEAHANGWLTPGAATHVFCEDDRFVSVVTPDFSEKTVEHRRMTAEAVVNRRTPIDWVRRLMRW